MGFFSSTLLTRRTTACVEGTLAYGGLSHPYERFGDAGCRALISDLGPGFIAALVEEKQ